MTANDRCPLFNSWLKLSLETMQLGFDAQRVIALRMMRFAAGGAAGQNESYRMVAEKIAAVGEAQTVAAVAIAAGQKIRSSPKKWLACSKNEFGQTNVGYPAGNVPSGTTRFADPKAA
jgi:hypothetical protein